MDYDNYYFALGVHRQGYIHQYYDLKTSWQDLPDWPELEEQGKPPFITFAGKKHGRKGYAYNGDYKVSGFYDPCLYLYEYSPTGEIGFRELTALLKRLHLGGRYRQFMLDMKLPCLGWGADSLSTFKELTPKPGREYLERQGATVVDVYDFEWPCRIFLIELTGPIIVNNQ